MFVDASRSLDALAICTERKTRRLRPGGMRRGPEHGRDSRIESRSAPRSQRFLGERSEPPYGEV